jgi:hypothetical protein
VVRPESTDYVCSNFNFPNWCKRPGEGNYYMQARGWMTGDNWVCARRDVSGGFLYV